MILRPSDFRPVRLLATVLGDDLAYENNLGHPVDYWDVLTEMNNGSPPLPDYTDPDVIIDQTTPTYEGRLLDLNLQIPDHQFVTLTVVLSRVDPYIVVGMVLLMNGVISHVWDRSNNRAEPYRLGPAGVPLFHTLIPKNPLK